MENETCHFLNRYDLEPYSHSGLIIKQQWLGLLDLRLERLAPLDFYTGMRVKFHVAYLKEKSGVNQSSALLLECCL